MRAKVTIVGGGMTGGTMAQRLVETGYVDIVLHDIEWTRHQSRGPRSDDSDGPPLPRSDVVAPARL